jgi:hypothetical protein
MSLPMRRMVIVKAEGEKGATLMPHSKKMRTHWSTSVFA